MFLCFQTFSFTVTSNEAKEVYTFKNASGYNTMLTNPAAKEMSKLGNQPSSFYTKTGDIFNFKSATTYRMYFGVSKTRI